MTNEDKAKKISEQNGISYKNYPPEDSDMMESTLECYKSALEMAEWKDSIAKEQLEHAIKMCNGYIKDHPENMLMIKFYLGQISALDKLLGTNSRDKINLAFATMD